MDESVSPELFMMLLGDARLPVAGHTQSGSLEPAVVAGLGAELVPDFIAARLATVTAVEAGTAVAALHALRSGEPLEDVVVAWQARTPSPALRQASRQQARTLLRLTTRLFAKAPATAVVAMLARPPRAVVVAAAADACGLAPASLARLVAYDDVQTVASAALKLLPLDPAEATGWVHDALPSIESLAQRVVAVTEPADIPASGSPQIEVWAQAHARTTRRLFSA